MGGRMTDELKTLKDLKGKLRWNRSKWLAVNEFEDDVRQLAIKWRKEKGTWITALDWDEFFNIKEEELK